MDRGIHKNALALKSIPASTWRPQFPQAAPLTKDRRSAELGLFLGDAGLLRRAILVLSYFLRTALQSKDSSNSTFFPSSALMALTVFPGS